MTLLEEPQAACYAWIDSAGERWRRKLRAGDLLLVCDIGGGTTDFSLILVGEHDGDLALERVAIGDHILLGGDNMDLALARIVQQRLEGEGHRIDTWQLQTLWHQCRVAKETLFAEPGPGHAPDHRSRQGHAAHRRHDPRRAAARRSRRGARRRILPARRRRCHAGTSKARVGLQELGLPYAADPAVTRHLARFLSQQAAGSPASSAVRRGPSGLVCPTHLLFNGGVMKASPLRARMVDVLNGWLTREGFAPLDAEHLLDAPDLDHAVARGAAYYGRARASGRGVRIRSGASRSYYIGIESALPAVPGFPAPLKALCVVPFGMEEGTSAPIAGREFGLSVGEPAEFRFLTSTIRKGDPPGTIIEDWGDDLEELGPLEVTLEADRCLGRRWRRAGDAREPRHRDRDARALVQRERRRTSLEAGAEHPRGTIRVKCPDPVSDWCRSRHHQFRRRRGGHAAPQSPGRGLPHSPADRAGRRRAPARPAVVPLLPRTGRNRRRRNRAAMGSPSQRHRRRAGARSRRAGGGAAGGVREIVARPSRGRSACGLSSLGQQRRHARAYRPSMRRRGI